MADYDIKKVHNRILETLLTVDRVCKEHNLRYYIIAGTLLGAVRHKGFIPWDDDLDMGMLRRDYEKFCRIAPEKLKPEYCLQTWYTEPNYALPFGKVMKRNTVYLENKKTRRLENNGIYVDIFPYDYAPEDAAERNQLTASLLSIYRVKLMKSGYRPWQENDRIIWKKRIGYLYYQVKSLFVTQQTLARDYDTLAVAVHDSPVICERNGRTKLDCYERAWIEELADYTFEGETFKGPKDYDSYLRSLYGEYMVLPPEGERENRHQIIEIDFGEE